MLAVLLPSLLLQALAHAIETYFRSNRGVSKNSGAKPPRCDPALDLDVQPAGAPLGGQGDGMAGAGPSPVITQQLPPVVPDYHGDGGLVLHDDDTNTAEGDERIDVDDSGLPAASEHYGAGGGAPLAALGVHPQPAQGPGTTATTARITSSLGYTLTPLSMNYMAGQAAAAAASVQQQQYRQHSSLSVLDPHGWQYGDAHGGDGGGILPYGSEDFAVGGDHGALAADDGLGGAVAATGDATDEDDTNARNV